MNIVSSIAGLEKPGKYMTVGSGLAAITSDVLAFPHIVGDIFGYLTAIGALGRVLGYGARKAS